LWIVHQTTNLSKLSISVICLETLCFLPGILNELPCSSSFSHFQNSSKCPFRHSSSFYAIFPEIKGYSRRHSGLTSWFSFHKITTFVKISQLSMCSVMPLVYTCTCKPISLPCPSLKLHTQYGCTSNTNPSPQYRTPVNLRLTAFWYIASGYQLKNLI
jgi:hypothetical protein